MSPVPSDPIPGQTSTGSKRAEALFGGLPGPLAMVRSDGCRVWDADGRAYIDMGMALGAVALGYAHPAVVAAATEAARRGGVSSLPPVEERALAERLRAWVPGGEAVRFLKTGAEAVAAAVRLARVVTGREHVLTCGYHGWLDWCQESPGVPEADRALHRTVRFNDPADLDTALAELPSPAAIVIEPVVAPELASARQAWMRRLFELKSRPPEAPIWLKLRPAPATLVAEGAVPLATDVLRNTTYSRLLLAVVDANEYVLASFAVWIAALFVVHRLPVDRTVSVTSSLVLSTLSFAVRRST